MRNQMFYSVLGMAVLFLVNGCQKPVNEAPVLELGQTTVTIGSTGGSGSVSYKVTNPVEGTKPTAKAEANDWVSDIAVTDAAITFNVAANPETAARSVKVTVSYPNAADAEFTISQSATELFPAIVLENKEFTAPAEGGSCSVNYSIENPVDGQSLKAELLQETSWLSNLNVSSTAITFDVAKNTVEESRSASITLTYEGAISVDLKVTQEPAAALEYTANPNWTVTYDGKDTEEGIGELISVQSTSTERYFISVCTSSDYSQYGIKAIAESELSGMEYYYGSDWYTTFSYTKSASEKWNAFSPGTYYALAIGIADDGTLNGLYQISEEFEPEQLEASESYKKWLGNWRIEDADGIGFDITLTEYSPEISYIMTGWQPNLELSIPVSYNAADGSLLFASVTDLIGQEMEFEADGEAHPTRVGFHGSGDDGYMWPGYDMATAALSSDGNSADVTGLSYDFTSQGYKKVNIASMEVMAVASDESNYVWTFVGDVPSLPMTMTKTAETGTTAVKSVAKPSRFSASRNSVKSGFAVPYVCRSSR